MDLSRRRQELGLRASAALPAIWSALRRKGWSHARFAREAGLTNGGVAKLLYGDVGAGRSVADFCQRVLGVRVPLWDEPCPRGWRPHSAAAARVKRSVLPSTGTDG